MHKKVRKTIIIFIIEYKKEGEERRTMKLIFTLNVIRT